MDLKEKKKIAADAYRERKNNARKIITDYLATSPKMDQNVLESIKYMIGSGVRTARTGVNTELKDLLLSGPVSLLDIFTKFEFGKPTMDQKIRGFIKTNKPEDRIWVAFEEGMYIVKGTGEKVPRGWTGYVPVVVEEL